ncbi:MAG: insulinase family protein [Acidobacteriaceae bacterium]|nr:insulinase family protein [Acidobacteriaceae bacterium]
MLRFLVAITSGVVLASGVLRAADVDRTKPPETPPIPSVKLPNIQRFQLPNGLRIVAAEDPRFPLLTVRMAFLAGSKYDPKDLPGLSDTVAALLNQGTATRNARQIADESADLGGQITATSSPDTLTLDGSCLSENIPQFMALLADVARNASFPEDEVQLQKQNRLETLRAERSQARYLGEEALSDALFGKHPYSHIGPTEAALGTLNKAALQSFRDTYLVPNNAFLILVGRLPERASLEKLISDQFGGWQQKAVPAYEPPPIPSNSKKLILVDRPGSVQADIMSAHLAPTYGSPEFFPLAVGDRILGGGTNSRLFQDIREKRGFAYDAHAENNSLKEAAVVSAVTEVRNEVVEPAVEALNADLQALSDKDVSATELTDAKDSYAGRFILGLERQSGLAQQLVRVETNGLPHDYLELFTTHVRSVEPDQIRATGKYWAPADATLVVVGDAQKIQKSLDKFGTFELTKPKQ